MYESSLEGVKLHCMIKQFDFIKDKILESMIITYTTLFVQQVQNAKL